MRTQNCAGWPALGIAERGLMAMKLSAGLLTGAILLSACTLEQKPMSRDLTDFGTRYAAAWSRRPPNFE